MNTWAIRITVPRSCVWCNRRSGLKVDERMCKRCGDRFRVRMPVWNEQRYWKTEVLSAGAAEIVRAKFSKAAIRDKFDFKVREIEQMELVCWRKGRKYVECVQRRNGFYVDLYECFDEPVTFTLRPEAWGWDKLVGATAERFWKGMIKVMKATVTGATP